MRVAISATVLGSERGGDETYLRALLAGLAETADPARERFPLFVHAGVALPPNVQGNPLFPTQALPRLPQALRYGLVIPLAMATAREKLDMLHSLIHAPVVSPVPTALYMPDLSFRHLPEHFQLSTRLRLNLLAPLHIRQARLIITVSEYSKRDIVRSFGIAEDRVFVVHGAVSTIAHPADPQAADERLGRHGLASPFFLYLGNLHPRKNVGRLIHAFALAHRSSPEVASHRLVIAGARWWGGREEDLAARALPPGSYAFLGRVSSDMRDDLLSRATALVYPSLFEGFGLPPLEAMAAGTPVIASNVTALPEILGDAAVLVDPHDTDALAAAIVRLATDPGLRAHLRAAGPRRASRFSGRAMGESALAAFRAGLALPTVRRLGQARE